MVSRVGLCEVAGFGLRRDYIYSLADAVRAAGQQLGLPAMLVKTKIGHFRKTHGEGGRRVANRVTEGEASGVQGAG